MGTGYGKENGYAQLRLPSGEVRMIALNCKATVGTVGNSDHENVNLGKAGENVTWVSDLRFAVPYNPLRPPPTVVKVSLLPEDQGPCYSLG